LPPNGKLLPELDGVPTISVPATAGVNAAKTSKTPTMSNAFELPEKYERIIICSSIKLNIGKKTVLTRIDDRRPCAM
jgi:hypothetical protein